MIINTRVKSSIFLYLKSERRNMATVKLWAIKRRLDAVVNYTTNDEKVSSNDYKIEKFKRHIEKLKEFEGIKKLNRKCIEELVEKIMIYENGNIIIKFRYQNEYLSLLNFKN